MLDLAIQILAYFGYVFVFLPFMIIRFVCSLVRQMISAAGKETKNVQHYNSGLPNQNSHPRSHHCIA
jgi:hypothetical protein